MVQLSVPPVVMMAPSMLLPFWTKPIVVGSRNISTRSSVWSELGCLFKIDSILERFVKIIVVLFPEIFVTLVEVINFILLS